MSNTDTSLALDGRVAVVSGAGAGLGRAHALMLARLGARVVVNDLATDVEGRQGVTKAEAVAEEIEAAGGVAVAVNYSVTSLDAGEVIVGRAVDQYGGIDIVVNNAGVLRDRAFAETDPQSWSEVQDTHVSGSYLLTRAAWPHMLASGYGRVVLTSSAAGLFGTGGNASYGTAKLGVVGLMKMLSVESAAVDINVNAIAPLALTAMSQSKGGRDRASDVVGNLFEQMPPEQVSQLVAWLVHPDCDVTGRIFSAGGGRVAEVFIGETRGWTMKSHEWTDIKANWDSIVDRKDYIVPANMAEEMREFVAALA